MAIAARAVFPVVFKIKDEKGLVGSFRSHVPATTTVADLNTAVGALGATIPGVTDGAYYGWSATVGAEETNPALIVPEPGSRRNRKGALTMATTEPGKLALLEIPAVSADVVRPDGSLNEDTTALDAFIDALVGGPWCDSNGNSLTGLVALYERYDGDTKASLPSRRVPDADADPAT